MNNLNLTELQPLMLQWAKDKNLLIPENAPKQRLKLIEECGELASTILKNDVKLQKDAIGDIFVVLTILAEQISQKINFEDEMFKEKLYEDYDLSFCFQRLFTNSICFTINLDIEISIYHLRNISLILNLDLTECANIAWNEIKNRTGNTINGTFIKD
jgi:hypothetical protein